MEFKTEHRSIPLTICVCSEIKKHSVHIILYRRATFTSLYTYVCMSVYELIAVIEYTDMLYQRIIQLDYTISYGQILLRLLYQQ